MTAPPIPPHVDVVVVGAGLSGIGAGHRLQTRCPDLGYLILEARDSIGGTWDLFTFPGVRSDSDMFTLSYPFRPWREATSIADGASILRYIRETAAELGVEEKVRYRTRVVAADWSSADARWTLTLERHTGGTVERTTMTCGFLYACAGYYDYDRPHDAQLPDLASYAGTVVHPQFWPEDLDWRDKRVLVVGSGATAVTMVPAMASEAAHVTMLQRSPTWVAAVPRIDRLAVRLRGRLPAGLAYRVVRAKNIVLNTALYQFCQRWPQRARPFLLGLATRALEDPDLVAEHFTPTYDPWDQRLCAIPDADLFRAVKDGRAEVVTDTIDAVVPEGVRTRSGRVIEADILVTATGLSLRAFGGIEPSVDGEPVALDRQFVWQGTMVTGIPNFALCFGYTNASWTLRADLSSRLVCTVLGWMADHDYAAVVPEPDRDLTERPMLELAAGYVQRSIAAFPRQGDRGPWRVRQNYLLDAVASVHTVHTARRDLATTLRPTRHAARGPTRPTDPSTEATRR